MDNMHSSDPIQLTRDCEAIAIPSGAIFTLTEGTEVTITQSLGGTYTVGGSFGLARIDARNQDALGLEKADQPEAGQQGGDDSPVSDNQVWDQLKTVYDPEIPVNIVDLGLVYTMELKKLEDTGYRVEMKMTLTAPGCGMGPTIQADAKYKILSIPGVREAEVDLVWEPAWDQNMITEEGRMKLGMI